MPLCCFDIEAAALRGHGPFEARSASDRTNDWPFWYVTNDGRTNVLRFRASLSWSWWSCSHIAGGSGSNCSKIQRGKGRVEAMKLQSDFALLDVKHGRKQLDKMMPSGSGHLPDDKRIPVTIHGYISHRNSGDDGVSIEFGVDVTKVEVHDGKS